jgi:hypothetical protein
MLFPCTEVQMNNPVGTGTALPQKEKATAAYAVCVAPAEKGQE